MSGYQASNFFTLYPLASVEYIFMKSLSFANESNNILEGSRLKLQLYKAINLVKYQACGKCLSAANDV